MTNNFASRHMKHISVLTKQLHEYQIGSELTPMMSILQNSVSLQVSHTQGSIKRPVSGFEEVLKSLPIDEIKSFVDGIQMLMERAKSIQDLILMKERENERRRTEARIIAERETSEQRIRELEAENARLEALIKEQNNAALGFESQCLRPSSRPKRAKMSIPLHAQSIQPPTAVSKDSSSKLPGFQRNPTHRPRNSDPDENSPEDSIESPGSPGKEAGYKPDLTRRKRRPLARPAEEAIQRSKRRALYPSQPTSDLEEEHVQYLREPVRIGSPTHLQHADSWSTHAESASHWPGNAEDPGELGAIPSARLGTPSAAMSGDDIISPALPKLIFGNAKIQSETATGQSSGLTQERAKAVWSRSPSLNPGLTQTSASQASAGDVKQELRDRVGVQPSPEPRMKIQESKLTENMEQMQEMVEKLSFLLEVGQHAMGAYENECDADDPNPGNVGLGL